jgi:hypothetical protein
MKTRALERRVVADATSWLLRALLLLRAEIDPQAVHEHFLDFRRFGFFRANTAQHVRELGWGRHNPDRAPPTGACVPASKFYCETTAKKRGLFPS